MDRPKSFFVWGIDDVPYGPVELPVLADWAREGRVLTNSWVFERTAGIWRKAGEITELSSAFETAHGASWNPGLTPGVLRRIKILANLKDGQLSLLSDFMEVQEAPQHTVVFRQGDSGDAMFLVLAGELRARTLNGEKETILATFTAGEFFGDMALFDNGPRSADVVANVNCTLLKISAENFYRLMRETPVLATPFLQATTRTLSTRIRAGNRRLLQVSEQFSANRGF